MKRTAFILMRTLATLLVLTVIIGTAALVQKPALAQEVVPYVTAEGFCRKYEPYTQRVYIQYTLRNNTGTDIPLQLATTMDIEGQPNNLLVKYTNCVSGGVSCFYRIADEYEYTLKAREQAKFTGEVKLILDPKVYDFAVFSSLVYKMDGKAIPLSLETTQNICYDTPAPAVMNKEITPLSLCRTYTKGVDSLYFSYALRNDTDTAIPLQLATTLEVDGELEPRIMTYEKCFNKDGSCFDRISDYNFTLEPKESVVFTGTTDLTESHDNTYFPVKTSLVYYAENMWKPLLIGKSGLECPIAPTIPDAPETKDNSITTDGKICRGYMAEKKKVVVTYTLYNNTEKEIPVQLATTLEVEGQSQNLPITYANCVRGDGFSCYYRIEDKYNFRMKPNEKATFTGDAFLTKDPENPNFSVYTSMVYTVNGEEQTLALGSSRSTCSQGKAAEDIINEKGVTLSRDKADEDFAIFVSPNNDILTFIIQMKNTTGSDIVIRPENIQINNAILDEYQGRLQINDDLDSNIDKDLTDFTMGNEFFIPANQNVTFMVSLPVDLAQNLIETGVNTYAAGWLFTINGEDHIYNGVFEYEGPEPVSKIFEEDNEAYNPLFEFYHLYQDELLQNVEYQYSAPKNFKIR